VRSRDAGGSGAERERIRLCHAAVARARASVGVVASLLLVLSLPLLSVIALAVRVSSPGPVFFTQERVGKDGRRYVVYKFRTMHIGAAMKIRDDGTAITEAGDPRVTRVGRYLRGGLDELPQLFNVLKGEMSIVGPRPDLPVNYQAMNEQQRKRYAVKPGITTLPAIYGRNDLPLPTRVELDVYYVENMSFLLDVKIIVFTLLMPFGIRAPQRPVAHLLHD
jgi:lipopolysaccharide/colanic/teichoic acid biosynthesis glycosyltransferase